MQPRLSRPHLSRTSIIRTCSRPANTLIHMCRGCGQWSLRGVATVAWQFYRVVSAKTGWPVYLYKCCWLWSCYICIVYRLCIINQVRKAGTSVIQTISLIRYASDQPVDKRGLDNRGCTVHFSAIWLKTPFVSMICMRKWYRVIKINCTVLQYYSAYS